MAKIYRTAKGKEVDYSILTGRNEEIRAIGNMNVNARGDEIDSNNRPIKTKQQQVQKFYQKQVKPAESQVTALEEDKVIQAEEPVEFPEDVVADDEVEVVKEDSVISAVETLDAIDLINPGLSETVKEIATEQAKPKGLAGAIQKVKDSKKDE